MLRARTMSMFVRMPCQLVSSGPMRKLFPRVLPPPYPVDGSGGAYQALQPQRLKRIGLRVEHKSTGAQPARRQWQSRKAIRARPADGWRLDQPAGLVQPVAHRAVSERNRFVSARRDEKQAFSSVETQAKGRERNAVAHSAYAVLWSPVAWQESSLR